MSSFYQLQTKQGERQDSTRATSGIPNPAKRAWGVLPFILLLCMYLLSPAHALAGQQHRLHVTENLLQQPILRDSLRSNERLRRYQQLTSPDGRFILNMQGDGNLVLYENGATPRWATNTVDSGATYAIMQNNGNLELHTASGNVVWTSNTRSDDSISGSLLKLQNDGNLAIYREGKGEIWATHKRFANQVLQAQEELISPNGRFNLVLQGDGNLVIYENRARVLWATNTIGSGATKLVMQSDGNLVLYTTGNFPLWATNTSSDDPALGPVMLMLNNEGNLIVYREPLGKIWASNMVTLLATSFEDLDISQPEEILPLVFQPENLKASPGSTFQVDAKIPTSQIKWQLDERSRTGNYAVNILPNGNPPQGDDRMVSVALLAPSFDLSQYKKVRLNFWLKNSWNRSDEEWNREVHLPFLARHDMSYWSAWSDISSELVSKHGQDGWWEIMIDLKGPLHYSETMQFGFMFYHPAEADPAAYVLIDDLKITAE